MLIEIDSGKAVELSPMFIWGLNVLTDDPSPPDLYLIDNFTKDEVEYKAIQERRSISVSNNIAREVFDMVSAFKEQDVSSQVLHEVSLTPRRISS